MKERIEKDSHAEFACHANDGHSIFLWNAAETLLTGDS